MGKIIGAIVLVVIGGLGLYFWMGRENPASVKEALSMGKRMQCTYSMKEGDQSVETSVAIDGEKFMSETKRADMTSYSLFDGSTQYTWTSKDKSGFKLSKSCLEELKQPVGSLTPNDALTPPDGVKAKDMKDIFDFAEDVKCEAAEVAVAVPTDVVFTDQCALMKQSARIMEELKAEMPK